MLADYLDLLSDEGRINKNKFGKPYISLENMVSSMTCISEESIDPEKFYIEKIDREREERKKLRKAHQK